MQTPETMRYPSGDGCFNWMFVMSDYNRIDLTLVPIEKLELIGDDSLTVVLLDKDGIIKPFAPTNDSDYHVKKPDALFYNSCCNNFFWCMQNVAKGIARDELPYAMRMYHTIVITELHDMTAWYIGMQHDFKLSAGKMGKYFKKYLSPELYEQYRGVYCGADSEAFWKSVFCACELFRTLAKAVADGLGYTYNQSDDDGIMKYLSFCRSK